MSAFLASDDRPVLRLEDLNAVAIDFGLIARRYRPHSERIYLDFARSSFACSDATIYAIADRCEELGSWWCEVIRGFMARRVAFLATEGCRFLIVD